jgi:hypothetical protein
MVDCAMAAAARQGRAVTSCAGHDRALSRVSRGACRMSRFFTEIRLCTLVLSRMTSITAPSPAPFVIRFASEKVTTTVGRNSVGLTVENTGDKRTSQLVDTLAEPFVRGAERLRADGAGVGLGLAIVKSITHAHDGTLGLTPRAAGGLRVTVQLPAAAGGQNGSPTAIS